MDTNTRARIPKKPHCQLVKYIIRPRGHKTFYVLNSAEHETLSARKYKNIEKLSFFSSSDKPIILFFVLMNVKMPTIVVR